MNESLKKIIRESDVVLISIFLLLKCIHFNVASLISPCILALSTFIGLHVTFLTIPKNVSSHEEDGEYH